MVDARTFLVATWNWLPTDMKLVHSSDSFRKHYQVVNICRFSVLFITMSNQRLWYQVYYVTATVTRWDLYGHTSRRWGYGRLITTLFKAILVDSILAKDVVLTQLSHAEVRPAAWRTVKLVHIHCDTVQVGHTEVQTLLHCHSTLVLWRSWWQLILVFLPLVLVASLAWWQTYFTI